MQPFSGSGKMICPLCSSRAIVTTAWPGRLPPLHYQPNVITKYRCQLGHAFKTVSTFDGVQYQEHAMPYLEHIYSITLCWV